MSLQQCITEYFQRQQPKDIDKLTIQLNEILTNIKHDLEITAVMYNITVIITYFSVYKLRTPNSLLNQDNLLLVDSDIEQKQEVKIRAK